MKYLTFIFFTFFAFSTIFSQSGCTDSLALNYDSTAVINNGSCLYSTKFQDFTFKYYLPGQISESSGLIFANGFLWTHNDSGNTNSFYKIDPNTGALVQEISVANAPNTDWEDIAYDQNFIYLGDFGNNDGDRKDLKILKICKDSILSKKESFISVAAEKINFSYADQVNFVANKTHNFDCESLIAKGDSLYIFTKDRGDLQTKLYALPKIAGTYIVSPLDVYNSQCLITGADYNPKTNEVALIGYSATKDKSYVFYLNDFPNSSFFKGNKRKLQLTQNYVGLQTEGICYISADSIAISCEKSAIPAAVFSFNKSSTHLLEIHEITDFQMYMFPNPSSDVVHISSSKTIDALKIVNVEGKELHSLTPKFNVVDLNLKAININTSGIYFIYLRFDNQIICKKLIID